MLLSYRILKPGIDKHTESIGDKGTTGARCKSAIPSSNATLSIQLQQYRPGTSSNRFVLSGRIGLNDGFGRFKGKGKPPGGRGTDATLEKGSQQGRIDQIGRIANGIINQNKKGIQQSQGSDQCHGISVIQVLDRSQSGWSLL